MGFVLIFWKKQIKNPSQDTYPSFDKCSICICLLIPAGVVNCQTPTSRADSASCLIVGSFSDGGWVFILRAMGTNTALSPLIPGPSASSPHTLCLSSYSFYLDPAVSIYYTLYSAASILAVHVALKYKIKDLPGGPV